MRPPARCSNASRCQGSAWRRIVSRRAEGCCSSRPRRRRRGRDVREEIDDREEVTDGDAERGLRPGDRPDRGSRRRSGSGLLWSVSQRVPFRTYEFWRLEQR